MIISTDASKQFFSCFYRTLTIDSLYEQFYKGGKCEHTEEQKIFRKCSMKKKKQSTLMSKLLRFSLTYNVSPLGRNP